MTDSAATKACLNCGAGLSGKYCAACGQQDRPLNPSLRDLLHDAAAQFFDFDGRIFRSLKTLFAAPGLLTHEYMHGRRAAWMAPVRLYFVISVLYFALGALPGGSGMGVPLEADPETDTDADALAALQAMGFSSEAELQQAIEEAGATWMPRAMFVLIPIFAALVQALQRGSGWHYPQHLIFALHVQSAWFCIFALSVVAGLVLRSDAAGNVLYVLALLGCLLYLVLAMRGAYGNRLGQAAYKAIMVGLAYGLITITLTQAIIVPIVLT